MLRLYTSLAIGELLLDSKWCNYALITDKRIQIGVQGMVIFNNLTHYMDFIHSTLKLPYIFNVLLSMLIYKCSTFFAIFFSFYLQYN